MFRSLQHTLLFTAWAILFAHSVVPHVHESTTNQEFCPSIHEHESNLLEALSHLFNFSTGEDHLEDYKSGSSNGLFIVPAEVSIAHLMVEPASIDYPVLTFPAESEQIPFRPLRAPPVYS